MRQFLSYCKIIFFYCFWKVRCQETELAVTGNMVWKFFFIPRKPIIIFFYIMLSSVIIVLFGILGFYQVFREIVVQKKSPLYTIEKPIGEVPTKIECYKLF